jgi:flagellar motility protein MotE (MotC chaperone)
MESLRVREQTLTARQKSLELAAQDLRNERTAIDELRKKVSQELADLEARLGEMETRAGDLDKERQKASRQMDDMKKSVVEFEGGEQERIKQMAGVYDAMAPASAAKILGQMADTGSMETAVKILAMMKERQVAKVLAEFGDPNVAAQLLEKLKGLKEPTPAPKK